MKTPWEEARDKKFEGLGHEPPSQVKAPTKKRKKKKKAG